MLAKIRSAFTVMRETWLLQRVPANDAIFQHLRATVKQTTGNPGGLRRYLDVYPPLGSIVIEKDWYHDISSGEMRLNYSNSLFADGCLRINSGTPDSAIIVFLPGNITAVDDVFRPGNHPNNMTKVAETLRMGLASWDWPLQGRRRDRCLYQGLRSLFSGEREYSRILPAVGTSLWREYVFELQFALAQIERLTGPARKIHVVGWSMGACFAYLAPLLTTAVRTTIAVGSCAAVKDLLAEGKTRVHGFFFYPLNGLAYFDLEDIVSEALNSDHPIEIIYGDQDPGCLESTSRTLAQNAAQFGHPLEITVLTGHGHVFSPLVKNRIVEFLTAA